MGCRATWIGRHSPLRSGDYRRRRWLSWSRTGIGWGGQHQRTCVIVPFVADWPTWMRPERPTTLRPNPANLTTVKMIEGVGDVAHCRAESRSQTRARIWTTLMNLRRIHQGLRLHSKERTKRRTAAAAAADATILSARRALTKGARDLPSDWCQVCAPQSRCTRLRSLPNRLSIRYFWVFFFFFGLSHRDSLTSSWDENVIETEGPSAHGMWPCRGETSWSSTRSLGLFVRCEFVSESAAITSSIYQTFQHLSPVSSLLIDLIDLRQAKRSSSTRNRIESQRILTTHS